MGTDLALHKMGTDLAFYWLNNWGQTLILSCFMLPNLSFNCTFFIFLL